MMKKLSIMLCAGLFATAFATGCKKDKKDGEGAAANTCDGVAAKIADHMSKGNKAGMDQVPPEMKAKMEEGMKAIPVAIAKACKDDKWSQEALDCVATAKDPKEDCDGKLTDAQTKSMMTAAMGAMGMGDMGAGMHAGHDMGAMGAGSGSGTGSGTAAPVADGTGSGSAVADGTGTGDMKPVAPGTYPATCQGVADRAAADIASELPAGMPADVPAKFGAMLVTVCTDDKWATDVIACGVTAADPKAECQGKLTEEQRTNLDAAQEKFGMQMMEAMAASGEMAPGGSTGIAECDALMASLEKLVQCDKIDAQSKQGYGEMLKSFGAVKMLPDDQKGMMADQCKKGITGMEQVAKSSGC